MHLLETFQPGRDIHALSHITGGGIVGNTSRVLQEGLDLDIDWNTWQRPAIFQLIQDAGMVPEDDMRRTFNLGIGLILLVPPGTATAVEQSLRSFDEEPIRMGFVVRK